MTAATLVGKIDGVRRFVVGDAEGRILEHSAQSTDNDTIVAATAFAANAFGKIGGILGLGNPQILSVKTPSASWVLAMRMSNVFVVECTASKTASCVESTLLSNDWVALIESPIEDSELEYVPTSQQSAPSPLQNQVPPAPAIQPTASPAPQNQLQRSPKGTDVRGERIPKVTAPARATPQRPIPPATRPTGPRSAANLQEAGALAYSESLLAELRRNLVKGQLKQAETVAAKLAEDAKMRNFTVDSSTIPGSLLEGIAMVLAGDAQGGLTSLKRVEKVTNKAPSMRWAALIWCARAAAGAGAGLDVANAYAQSALALASQLDTEARAVSTFELAGVVFHQGDSGEALELTHTARSLFANTSDAQLLASCWLLEARVLAAIGSHEESIAAAAQAREQRPSWPPPATFIARRAIKEGRLREADNALQPLLAQKPTATEVERTHRIIEYVRSGVTPSQAAFDFLELVDAPPTPRNIRQLEELSEAYPRIEHFRDAFGWQLLRAGQYDSASVIFERLAARADLAEDVRSSVLLALGCLAAVGTRHAKPGVRIRAAVDAAPKNFKSVKPTPPSSGKMKVAPAEFRLSDLPPPSSVLSAFAPEESGTSPRTVPGGPVFSGNLQLFGLPDLLEFLRSGQRTGTLLCSSTAGIGAIHMRRGRITGAASPKTKGLRDYLFAMGVVNKQGLQQVSELNAGDRGLIGGVLVRMGLATSEQVGIALRDQVRDAVQELMNWGVGQFAFDPEAITELSTFDVDVDFDPQEVLLNIFRELDEKAK